MRYLEPLEDCFRPELVCFPDLGGSDILAACQQLWTINRALDQFLYGDLSESDFCDILEANGQRMDDYLAIAVSNVEAIGLDLT